MATIIIAAPQQPHRTPRMVRNANALAAAAHEVRVITPVLESHQLELDRELARAGNWTYQPMVIGAPEKPLTLKSRFARKLSALLLGRLPLARFGAAASVYASGRLLRLLDTPADFYFAQQQSVLPLIGRVARKRGKPFGCDVEDVLSEEANDLKKLYRKIEETYLKQCALVSTMSEAARDYLLERYRLAETPIVLHNTPASSERDGVKVPGARGTDVPSIYWFGQTLGPHSCAIELLRANVEAGSPFRIRLRGRPVKGYVEALIREDARAAHPCLEILPVVSPDRMVSEAAKSEVLFGSQPSEQLFHQLAIGNKVFTGLAAGCVLLLEDTVAHRRLREWIPECVELVRYREHDRLTSLLRALSRPESISAQRRESAWLAATVRFNWDIESKALTERVASITAV